MSDAAVDASREHGGRVLVLDAYGTVQADSYSLLNGTQLKHPEVVAVLGGKASAEADFATDDDEDFLG